MPVKASYLDLIARKRVAFTPHGLDVVPDLHPAMFPHQRHSTEFALRAGCAALFLGTGLGKSLCALDWGRVVVEHTRKPVLMLAPLAVGQQHAREAERFGIDAQVIRSAEEMGARRIYITNYERLDAFDPDRFGGVILDESSVLKNFTGKTTRRLTSAFAHTPFRLACTAAARRPRPSRATRLSSYPSRSSTGCRSTTSAAASPATVTTRRPRSSGPCSTPWRTLVRRVRREPALLRSPFFRVRRLRRRQSNASERIRTQSNAY